VQESRLGSAPGMGPLSVGLAPPVAAAPLAASGLALRLPLGREFGGELAKVFP